MRELPRAAAIYVAAVFTVGLAVLAVSAPSALAQVAGRTGEVLLFLVLGAVADLSQIPLSRKQGERASYSVATALNFTTVILFGPAIAISLAALTSVVGDTWKRKALHKIAFNSCAIGISVAAGGTVFQLVRGAESGVPTPADLPGLVGYAAVNVLVNTVLVYGAITLDTGARPWALLTSQLRATVATVVAMYPLGVLIAVTYSSFGGWRGLLLLVIPMVAVSTGLRRAQELNIQTSTTLQAVRAREEAQRQVASQTAELVERRAEAAALRHLSQLKTEFLQTVTHELRTPLTTVCGYAELLQSSAATLRPEERRMVKQLVDGSRQLEHLVDDLLVFARTEREDVRVEPEVCDLSPLLEHIVAGFQERKGGARVRAVLPPTLPAYADPTRVAQMASDLVDNAVKYAPSGTIDVRAWSLDGCTVRIEVADRGPGIPANEQPHVWEKFYRGTAATRSGAEGSGIGLAVVKALAEAQRGATGFRSELGSGTSFWLDLPASAAAYAARAPVTPGTAATRDTFRTVDTAETTAG